MVASEAVGPILELGSDQLDFGSILLGTPVTLGVSLENGGDQPLRFVPSLGGSNAAAFSLVTSCLEPIAPGASCIQSVRFLSNAVGDFSAELVLTPEGQAPAVVSLSASTLAPGALSVNAGFFDFGRIETEAGRGTFRWQVTNGGGVATGPLVLRSNVAAPFGVDQNGCTGPLAPGATCNIDFSFAPTTAGPFTANQQLDDASTIVSLSLSGRGVNRLTVTRVGSGQISSTPSGLSCNGDVCSGLFDTTSVVLRATTGDGSGSFFSGWSPGDCRASQECPFDLAGSRDVTATFQQQTNNLIFVSSTLQPPNLGGLARYDAECNRLASLAGINDAGGNAFIAAMSASNASLRQRLAGARGWVRLDGMPFGDTLAAIFDNQIVHYAAAFDERGALTPSNDNYFSGNLGFDPLTGTLSNGGSAPDNCNDWSSIAPGQGAAVGARASGGPRSWLNDFVTSCDLIGPQRIVCMGKTRSAPIVVPRFTGKQMWTAFDYTPGSMTPDQKCQSVRPPGVANAAAFIGYTDRPAAAVLDPEQTYVRPDGALIGLGAEVARQRAIAGPWLGANAAFNPNGSLVWTGSYAPDVTVQDPNESCNDWRSSANTLRGVIGDYGTGGPRWFYTGGIVPCDVAGALYCVEQ